MEEVHLFDIFELCLTVSDIAVPYIDVELEAEFQHINRSSFVEGFYDGEGIFRLRFMPDKTGEWHFTTHSNLPDLDGVSGVFSCISPRPGMHGPVRANDRFHFAYEDGTRYVPVGTTCYAWVHQGDTLESKTLETLKVGYFNKIRMCIFPKDYHYNQNEPAFYPFQKSESRSEFAWDFSRSNPAFWHHLEQRIQQLGEMGIEADLILWHPYDRWGFADMGAENDDRYLRYAIARLSAHHNVWWSLANEYDLMTSKELADWDRFFHILQEYDPIHHLRSIHNCRGLYNHGHPWVTHASIQHGDVNRVHEWRQQYQKPVVIDECGYEGDIEEGWGNFTPQEHLRRFWVGFTRGGYVGHGETYYNLEEVLWWSKGGVLRGQSAMRIRFLREILSSAPDGLEPLDHWGYYGAHCASDYFLIYLETHQPHQFHFDLPETGEYHADIIDTWEMTITPLPGIFKQKLVIDLPVKPYLAIRITKIAKNK